MREPSVNPAGINAFTSNFSEYVAAARSHIENVEWEKILSEYERKAPRVLDLLQTFEKVFPKSQHRDKIKRMHSHEDGLVKAARQGHCVSAYEEYIEKTHLLTIDASGLIEKETQARKACLVKTTNDPDKIIRRCRAFLKEWPNSASADEIRTRIDHWQAEKRWRAEEAAWENVVAVTEHGADEDIVAELEVFRKAWPLGEHADEARSLLDHHMQRIEDAAKSRQTKSWDAAVEGESVESYSQYLNDFPEGEWTRHAQMAIEVLEIVEDVDRLADNLHLSRRKNAENPNIPDLAALPGLVREIESLSPATDSGFRKVAWLARGTMAQKASDLFWGIHFASCMGTNVAKSITSLLKRISETFHSFCANHEGLMFLTGIGIVLLGLLGWVFLFIAGALVFSLFDTDILYELDHYGNQNGFLSIVFVIIYLGGIPALGAAVVYFGGILVLGTIIIGLFFLTAAILAVWYRITNPAYRAFCHAYSKMRKIQRQGAKDEKTWTW